jgi:hypothetical protein
MDGWMQIEGLADSFQPGEFARLSQALPAVSYSMYLLHGWLATYDFHVDRRTYNLF